MDWERLDVVIERYKTRILKTMRSQRYTFRGSRIYRDWTVAQLAEVVRGTSNPYWSTRVAIYKAMEDLTRAHLVQCRTINALEKSKRRFDWPWGETSYETEHHYNLRTAWVLVKRVPAPRKGSRGPRKSHANTLPNKLAKRMFSRKLPQDQ